MANLDSLIRWQKFTPDLGRNRELAQPFFVELAIGLTKPDLQRLAEAVDLPLFVGRADDAGEPTPEETEAAIKARVEALAKAIGPYVKMGAEPLVVNNERIETLAQLMALYTTLAAGPAALLELPTALRWFNSAGGTTQLFFERLSGGSGSTTSPVNGKATATRAAR